MFRPGDTATDGNMNPSGNLSFTKRTLVGWMSGRLTQRDGITLAEGLHDSGRWALSLFQLCIGTCLTAEEKHGNFTQVRRLVLDTCLCVDLAGCIGAR
jgi:hypothetical protein